MSLYIVYSSHVLFSLQKHSVQFLQDLTILIFLDSKTSFAPRSMLFLLSPNSYQLHCVHLYYYSICSIPTFSGTNIAHFYLPGVLYPVMSNRPVVFFSFGTCNQSFVNTRL